MLSHPHVSATFWSLLRRLGDLGALLGIFHPVAFRMVEAGTAAAALLLHEMVSRMVEGWTLVLLLQVNWFAAVEGI